MLQTFTSPEKLGNAANRMLNKSIHGTITSSSNNNSPVPTKVSATITSPTPGSSGGGGGYTVPPPPLSARNNNHTNSLMMNHPHGSNGNGKGANKMVRNAIGFLQGGASNAIQGASNRFGSNANSINEFDRSLLPAEGSYSTAALQQKYATEYAKLHVSEQQIQMICNNTEIFQLLQSKIRESGFQTDALTHMLSNELLHVGLDEIHQQNAALEKQRIKEKNAIRSHQHKEQLQREMTEARIKAQHAMLKHAATTNSETDDDDEENTNNIPAISTSHNGGSENTASNDDDEYIIGQQQTSPTSVMAIIEGSELSGVFKDGLRNLVVADDANDDDDIQEV